MASFLISFGLLLFPPASATQGAEAETQPEPREIEVVHLANEGFLLRAGEDAVLIDAFVAEPYSIYAALSPEAADALATAAAPFDKVKVALASHVHRDHFQPEIAGAFLDSAPSAVFASSPDALELLRQELGSSKGMRAVLPEEGQRVTLDVEGVQVEFLRLSHGTGRFQSIQNLGHVIRIGGQKILHVGDAQVAPQVFAPYELVKERIDVALVPYWYFDSPEGRRIVKEQFNARHVVAVHVPPRELRAVTTRLSEEGIHVFQRCLEAKLYAPR